MNPKNQSRVKELFKEKDNLLKSLDEASKHEGHETMITIRCSMAQVSDFRFDYQDATKLILPMIIGKMS